MPLIPKTLRAEDMNSYWQRAPRFDKRFEWGDDYAGDAWRNPATGELRWVAVGRNPNESNA